PVNDAPTITAGGTLNYTENQAATAIDTTVVVNDVDNANLNGATVQLTTNYVNGQDILGFTTQNGITGVFTAANGTMTLSGSATLANYQTALRSVTYFNNSNNPSGLSRTVVWQVSDGTANSTTNPTSTINVTPVNDPPTDPDESFAAQANVGINVTAANGLLVGATDPEGDTISMAPASVGTFT